MSERPPRAEHQQEAGLLDVWRALRRRKYIVALMLIVGVAAAVGVVVLQKPQYTSNTQLLFLQQISNTGTGASNAGNGLTPGQLATDIQLIQSSPVKSATAKIWSAGPKCQSRRNRDDLGRISSLSRRQTLFFRPRRPMLTQRHTSR